jgi:hypothetical protein
VSFAARCYHQWVSAPSLPKLAKVPKWALWALGAAAIAAVMVYFRLNYQTRLLNGDDWIVLGVAQGMAERGDLNTNWAVNPVPPEWVQPQFNFSSYNLVSHGILSLAPDWLAPIPVLRGANLVYQALTVLLLALALKNARTPGWGIALASALFAIAPAFVHDAHMLRTESLLYLLFAIVVWAATSPRRLWIRVAVAGLAIGFGAASKINFLATGLVMAPAVLIALRQAPARGVRLMLVAGLSSAAGFAVGAPYALLDPAAYLEGLQILNAQYAGGHRPHSRVAYDLFGLAAWVGSFFLVLYGPLVLAGLVIPALNRPPAWVVGVWLSSAATFLWFLQQRTFFERSFSLAVIGAILLIGWLAGRRPRTALAIALASAMPMLWWSQQILEETLDHYMRRWRWEQAQGLVVAKYVQGFVTPPADVSRCRGVFGVMDFNDDWTDGTLAALDARGKRRLAHYRSRFHLVPTSTLQNFLDHDVVYYACRGERPQSSGVTPSRQARPSARTP